MTVPANIVPLLMSEEAGAAGYQVSRSLRFNSADSSFLSRTPGSAGNRRTWTWAGWVKTCSTKSSEHYMFSAAGSGQYFIFGITNNDEFFINPAAGVSGASFVSSNVFRDRSAWYHFVVSFDSTQATSTNRLKVYVNGVALTWSTASYPSQNADWDVNNNVAHRIGSSTNGTGYIDQYLADVHFIDGQALTPSSFTETDANGVLQPKAYSGSYGTNGFKLSFSDNASAAALGTDTSGNGNTWTVNNLSVTAGAGNDSLVDSPTNYGTDTGAGGEVRGNYATLNPLKTGDTTSFAQGNLFWRTTSNGPDRCVLATIGMSSGKWYWECYMDEGTATAVGVALDSVSLTTGGAGSNSYVYYSIGTYYNSGSSTGSPSSFTTGDLISVAFDADTGKIWFAKNGTWQGSGDPGAGTNPAMTLTTGLTYFPLVGDSGGASQSQVTANFGQRAFAYTNNRSGFKALCTQNLPAPVIAQPSTAMDVKLYTGTAATQSITGLGFSPDFVWIKNRNGTAAHHVFDIVRGATKRLITNGTQDDSYNAYDSLTSFDTSGFTLGADTSTGCVNNPSSATYAAWCWDAGSSTVTNTQGSINSQVRANQNSGFSIVTFTSPSSGNFTIGHGLGGVAPAFVLVKTRGTTSDWSVYHASATTATDKYLVLNSTAAVGTYSTIWGAALPTSTVIGLTSGGAVAASQTCVAYCFSPVSSYSSFGSYVGNGSSDGPFVYCGTGFRPRWVMIKCTTTAESWILHDTARSSYNVSGQELLPNNSGAEYTYTRLDILSNGFKIRTTEAASNTNGSTYIYCAFAESPFQTARAR